MKFLLALSCLLFFLIACATKTTTPSTPTPAQPVLALENQAKTITDWGVSGISSGAMMSAQLGIAHSEKISNVGLFSGSIYGCSQGNVQTALKICMADPSKINEKDSLRYVQKKKIKTEIDNLANLKKQKIFLFHGKLDKVVKHEVVSKNEYFYQKLKAPTKSLSLDHLGHSFATKNPSGSNCENSSSPYISNCNYDSIDELFKYIYPAKTPSLATPNKARLFSLNAESFIDKTLLEKAFFNKEILVYVPQNCEQKSCSAHLALHGCHQAPEFVGMDFIMGAGYLEAAEKYQTIVVFPSVLKSTTNPYGCWDWWGYSDAQSYDTKQAPQIQVLEKIMGRL